MICFHQSLIPRLLKFQSHTHLSILDFSFRQNNIKDIELIGYFQIYFIHICLIKKNQLIKKKE